jgi:hypothetical protein
LTEFNAGKMMAISSAIIAITTRSSISVNPVNPKDSAERRPLRDFRRKLRCRFRTSVWLPAKRGPSDIIVFFSPPTFFVSVVPGFKQIEVLHPVLWYKPLLNATIKCLNSAYLIQIIQRFSLIGGRLIWYK